MVGMLLCQHCSETVIHICLQGVSGEGGLSSGTPNKPSLATRLQKKMVRETMKRQGNWFITVLCGSQGVNMWSSVSRKYWPWPSGEVGKIWSQEQKSWPVWCLSPISSCLFKAPGNAYHLNSLFGLQHEMRWFLLSLGRYLVSFMSLRDQSYHGLICLQGSTIPGTQIDCRNGAIWWPRIGCCKSQYHNYDVSASLESASVLLILVSSSLKVKITSFRRTLLRWLAWLACLPLELRNSLTQF